MINNITSIWGYRVRYSSTFCPVRIHRTSCRTSCCCSYSYDSLYVVLTNTLPWSYRCLTSDLPIYLDGVSIPRHRGARVLSGLSHLPAATMQAAHQSLSFSCRRIPYPHHCMICRLLSCPSHWWKLSRPWCLVVGVSGGDGEPGFSRQNLNGRAAWGESWMKKK